VTASCPRTVSCCPRGYFDPKATTFDAVTIAYKVKTQ
jgi:hypothetical protein